MFDRINLSLSQRLVVQLSDTMQHVGNCSLQLGLLSTHKMTLPTSIHATLWFQCYVDVEQFRCILLANEYSINT